MATETEPQVTNLSQVEFEASAYEPQSWEVMGEFENSQTFEPMEFSVLPDSSAQTDPMFADFGGYTGEGQPKRWHLPADVQQSSGEDSENASSEGASSHPSISEEELNALKEEAYQRGKRETTETLGKEYEAKLAASGEILKTIVNDMQAQVTEQLKAIEQGAVDLSIVIAKRIINFAVEINPEYIIDIVRQALHASGAATIKKVRVSPEDMEFITVLGVEKQLKEFDGSWTFEGDATVRAGCIVETSAGETDFQLDEAWERVKNGILKVVR